MRMWLRDKDAEDQQCTPAISETLSGNEWRDRPNLQGNHSNEILHTQQDENPGQQREAVQELASDQRQRAETHVGSIPQESRPISERPPLA